MMRMSLSVGLALFAATAGPAAEWTHWRGPFQNGVAPDTGLPDKFTTDPADPDSNLIWKAPYGCRSTPAILNGRVFIINSEGSGINEGERVMAFDAATGKVLWEHKFNVFQTDIVSSRVGWANVAADAETGNVYAHGVQGLLFCLDGATGKVVWKRSLTEEYGRVTGYGGRVVSPVVTGDLVVVGMINASWGDHARGNNRFVAFDKRTGQVRWWSTPCELNKLTYNSIPVEAFINGQKLLITGTADGAVTAIQADTGKRVWQYFFGAQAINSSPVVDGNLVYITHGQENIDEAQQGRVICLDASQMVDGHPKLVWQDIGVKADLSSPLLIDGRLYVPDDGATLHCYDAKTGKKIWKHKYGRVARAAPVYADGKIWIAEVNSKFHILKPGDRRCTTLAEIPFFSGRGVSLETNGTAAVANGRVYFGTETDFYCVGKKEWTGSAKVEKTIPAATVGQPAQALVVPGDVLLSPGGSAAFTVKLYDKDGAFVRDADKVEWSLPLPPKTPTGAQPPALAGTIADGKLTVAAAPPGQAGYVEAKVGDLTARARVRVAPVIPYKLDLSKVPVGSVPGGWVNTQGKFAVVELDGRRVLQKLAENPLPPVARAIAYITGPDAADYVIQADLMGKFANNNLPDMGIVNCRYTLQLNGNKQQLRLLSWEAMPRVDKTIDFAWKPEQWYTLKLALKPMGDKTLVQGKIWPRGTEEPAAWTVEVEDPRPNTNGAAAVYGFATGIFPMQPGATAFYDNITITPNR
jgi:outer membrane protein assembly factor BamB